MLEKLKKEKIIAEKLVKGIFLTRDLVSEPANVLYPSKFVDICNVLKKSGVKTEVLDEKDEISGYECSTWSSPRIG